MGIVKISEKIIKGRFPRRPFPTAAAEAGRCPETKGELTFGKLAEQVIRFSSRTFSHYCLFIHCINECHCEGEARGNPFPYFRAESFMRSARWRLRIMDLANPSLFSPARLADNEDSVSTS